LGEAYLLTEGYYGSQLIQTPDFEREFHL